MEIHHKDDDIIKSEKIRRSNRRKTSQSEVKSNDTDSKFQNLYLTSNEIPKKISRDRNIFLYGIDIKPIKNLNESYIHEKVKDYFHINGFNSINEFESYLWPAILRGRHVLAVSSSEVDSELNFTVRKRKSKLVTFISPLLTLILRHIERENELKDDEKLKELPGTKKLVSKRKNGPLLLIICSSCKNAQRIYELISTIMINDKKLLKVILLQGGGHDGTYDIKLSNGCDILICATPYCLLRMIGNGNTNLERLKYFTIDEADIVLEKYPRQIRTLMDHYANLLKIEVRPAVAQFVLFSSTWSNKLHKFINSFFMDETIIFESKLETSCFGRVNHYIHEVDSTREKLNKLIDLLELNSSCNIVIFLDDNSYGLKLCGYLQKKGYLAQFVDSVNVSTIEKISSEWHESDQLVERKQLILICLQEILGFINIRNAHCVIHYDFPRNKQIFAERLWLMSDNYKLKKVVNSANVLSKANQNTENSSENGTDKKESLELASHIFLTKSDQEFSEGLLNFLKRAGVDELGIPKLLFKMADERRKLKEEKQIFRPLCPFTKSYGKCVSPLPKCDYRHKLDENIDKLRKLSYTINEDDSGLSVPCEGYVKFKIAHIKETNQCFVHLLTNQIQVEDGSYKTIDYDLFNKLDFEMQFYYSDIENRISSTRLSKKKLYAFQDIETTIFKRIKIIEVIVQDNKVAYEALIECIDYGSQLVISSDKFVELPEQFTLLPPQAVEVYFCDIRPVDRDLNWSVASKLFISDKLAKSKEFYGKVRLAAGNTLWLHPVTSQKRLELVNVSIIDDCVRRDLLDENYAVLYSEHLTKLTKLFEESNFPIPKSEIKTNANESLLSINTLSPLEYDYNNNNNYKYKLPEPAYAFLDKEAEYTLVQLSVVTTSSNIFLQKMSSQSTLDALNKEMDFYIFDNLNKDDFIKRKNLLLATILNNRDNPEILSSCYCVAKLSSETYYSRAQVIEFVDEDYVRVFFVDYGDYDNILINNLYPIEDKFITKLPFQAIKCCIDDLTPPKSLKTSVEDWHCDIGDLLWKITHDSENYYYKLLVHVVKEIKDDDKLFKHKSYIVDLYRYNAPIPVNVSNIIVATRAANFNENKEAKLFPFIQPENYDCVSNLGIGLINNLAKLCVTHFIRNNDERKQYEYIIHLKTRLVNVDSINDDDLIKSGLMQTLSQSIYFISEKKYLINILQFIQKKFFNKEKILKEFCEYSGIDNLLILMFDCVDQNEEFFDFLMEIVNRLLEINLVKEKFLNESKYFQSLWYLLKHAKDEKIYRKILSVIEYLSKIDDIKYVLKQNDVDYMDHIIKVIEGRFYIDDLLNIRDSFSKLTDVNPIDLLPKIPLNTLNMIASANKNAIDDNNNALCDYDDCFSLNSSNSSDFEVEQEFMKDFMNIWTLGHQQSNIQEENNKEDKMWISDEYLYPKLMWDQSLTLITLNVLLKGVQEFDIKYLTSSISFRTKINGNQYGFDFELYSSINPEECSTNVKSDVVSIFLRKEKDEIWPRLLSTLNKPKFLSCAYDNIGDDLKDEEKSTFQKYQRTQSSENVKSYYLDPLEEDESSIESSNKDSDSDTPIDSNFEDDLHDSKDILWD